MKHCLRSAEKWDLNLFVWAGCSMHKDLNSVKGGNKAMMSWWSENGETGPVRLANRDNAAVLNNMATEDVPNPAERRAMDVTTCGGVKAASIAGHIFSNKDDKKGYQDLHKRHFEPITGKWVRFPDTSNTRYQSFGEAAAELLVYRSDYQNLMETVRLNKTKQTLNHMESNLKVALDDIPTLTELAVLTLYAQAISHPYMKKVRGPGTEDLNMLNMGPLHEEVKQHIQMIIDDPDILLGDGVSYQKDVFGQKWHRPDAFETVHKLSPQLPHLQPVLVAFFKGALITFERFTSEFAAGSPIDLASATEKELAWMPPTNDVNEGALGSYRLYIRKKPTTTVQQYNALAMFNFNGTEEWMGKGFTAEDHQWLMGEGRKADNDHSEKKFREILRADKLAKAAAAAQKALDRAATVQKKVDELAVVVRTETIGVPKDWNMKALEDQLQLYRNLGVPTNIVPKFKSHLKNNTARWEALKAGIDWYKSQSNSTTEPSADGTPANAVSQDTGEDTGDGYGSGSDVDN